MADAEGPENPIAADLSAVSDEGHAGYPGWRVAGASAAGVFFAALVVVTFPVLLKPWATEFAWSRQQVATAFAIAALVAAVCAYPLGILLDRFGPRRIAVPSLALLGIVFASLWAAGPWPRTEACTRCRSARMKCRSARSADPVPRQANHSTGRGPVTSPLPSSRSLALRHPSLMGERLDETPRAQARAASH